MMLEAVYHILETALPFEWVRYDFMKNALLAVVIMTPVFALMGTVVVGNRMVFFSDVLGHSALTGVALGVLLGIGDPFWAMLIFAVILAVLINLFKGMTHASADTTLGVFFALVVALGVVLLSRGGGFSKYTVYLIGDILTVSPGQVLAVAGLFLVIGLYWVKAGNHLTLISVNPVLARSRGVKVFWVETSFVILLAVVVAVAVRIVGMLMINSLLILPAATARNLTGNMRDYALWSIGISLFSGIAGLLTSYYWGTAAGATIVLYCGVFYTFSVFWGKKWRRTFYPGE